MQSDKRPPHHSDPQQEHGEKEQPRAGVHRPEAKVAEAGAGFGLSWG